jgi:hypothetical protein
VQGCGRFHAVSLEKSKPRLLNERLARRQCEGVAVIPRRWEGVFVVAGRCNLSYNGFL